MKIICKICNWKWIIESNDADPYLCHKCGFNNKLEKFQLNKLINWQLKHIKLFKDFK